ncbi:MAG: hypothetical protein AAFO94_23250, partial [Bacteroidota bacterium]
MSTQLLGRLDAQSIVTNLTHSRVFVGGQYLHTLTGTIVVPLGEPRYEVNPTKELTFFIRNASETFINASLTTRVMQLGTRWRTGPTWTVASPEVPQMILRDPPGDLSFGKFQKDTEKCHGYALSMATDASVGADVSVKLGKKGSAGIGVETEYEAYVETTASLEMGMRQATNNSYNVCFKTSQEWETDKGQTPDFPAG